MSNIEHRILLNQLCDEGSFLKGKHTGHWRLDCQECRRILDSSQLRAIADELDRRNGVEQPEPITSIDEVV